MRASGSPGGLWIVGGDPNRPTPTIASPYTPIPSLNHFIDLNMSAAQNANDALSLVAEKVRRLIMRAQKLKEGDPAARPMAHEIAVTLDKSSPNGKLKGLPDWSTTGDDDNRIRGHPLFLKMVGYQRTQSPALALAPTPTPAPAPAPPAVQLLVSTTFLAGPVTPMPPSPPPAPKHNLFVMGNVKDGKRKEPPAKTEDEDEAAEPKKPKAVKLVRKAPQKKAKFTIDDEEGHPTNAVIYVKTKPTAGPSALPAVAPQATSTGTHGGVEIEKLAAETPKDLDASTGPIIDNDINMDFAIDDPVADLQPSPKAAINNLVIEPQPSPEAIRDELPSIPPAQPTPLDIFQSIEALGNKFDFLFQTSVDRVEAVETQVNSMEEKLAMKFAAIDEKIRAIDLTTINNTISLGHMANKMSVFTQTGNTTAFNPPAAMSVGNHYGQMPSSWLPWVADASQYKLHLGHSTV
ncbi:hypothetical protein EV702DRAFT_1201646 [Suillus placidus]|uniref:Uncharacterized protein n=1 Tax=Suillus placidus TaxID=48579 RepID=A0A9P6ZP97_9AGAM|nr:hypothetical protein EV702DRAFT_1201646 [Suillus placidus]